MPQNRTKEVILSQTIDFANYLKENPIYNLTTTNLELEKAKAFTAKHFSLVHIKEITFDEKAPRKEAFENVISSVREDGVNFLYLIMGDTTGVSFYFGIVKDLNKNKKLKMSVQDIGKKILMDNILGNFRGSKVDYLKVGQRNDILDKLDNMKTVAYLEGLPTINQDNEDNEDIQGIDRLVSVMRGETFALSIVASPLNNGEIHDIEESLWEFHNRLSYVSKTSVQESASSTVSANMGESVNDNKTEGTSKGFSEGTSRTKGSSDTVNKSVSHSKNDSISEGTNSSTSKGLNESLSEGTNQSHSVGKNASTSQGTNKSQSLGTNSSSSQGTNQSQSLGKNASSSQGTNTSQSQGTNKSSSKGTNKSSSLGSTSNVSQGVSSNRSSSENQSKSVGKNASHSFSKNSSVNQGTSTGVNHSSSKSRGTSSGTNSGNTASSGTTYNNTDKYSDGDISRGSNTGTSKSYGTTTGKNYGTSSSQGTSSGTTKGRTDGTSNSDSQGTNSSRTSGASTSQSRGTTSNTSEGTSANKTKGSSVNNTTGSSKNKTQGSSSNKTTGTSENNTQGSSSNKTSGSSENNTQGSSMNATSGTNQNDTQGTSANRTTGSNQNKTHGSSRNQTQGTSSSTTSGDSQTKNIGLSTNDSTNESINQSRSTGKTINEGASISNQGGTNKSYDVTNKRAQELIKYLDEILIKRVNHGRNRGLFNINMSLFAENEDVLHKLGNTMRSLSSGDAENKAPLSLNSIADDSNYYDYARSFQIPIGEPRDYNQNVIKNKMLRITASQYINDERKGSMSNWGSIGDLSIIAGLPQKEVVGLSLKEEVEFGSNPDIDSTIDGDEITLGSLVLSGNPTTTPIKLSEKDLNKHVFIAGTTGSGKTTTCRKVLLESHGSFLIIEPAKTEYRVLKDTMKDLIIFTLGDDDVAPFRLNPLEFSRKEKITGRVDVLKASIESAFDMEAAIPQLIEATIYQCYENNGWNIHTNKNSKYEDPFAEGVYSFPTLQDVLDTVESVATAQGFDDRLKNDYIGSIKARLQSLLQGSKGAMLNTKRSVNFHELVKKRVVIELEQIRNGGEKSLIMGFVMANLNQAIIENYEENRNFKHITLVEEAHRLLSKCEPGDNPSKRQGVEVFTDMLAEVRKYGESLIIVDQIPNKLTPEVLKNTNTKIIHKILAQDDKDAVGNTMALNDEQKDFLSNLPAGRAIVVAPNISKPQQVAIQRVENVDDTAIIPKDRLRQDIFKYYLRNREQRIIPGLYRMPTDISIEDVEYIFNLSFDDTLNESLTNLLKAPRIKFRCGEHIEIFKQIIAPLCELKGIPFVVNYLLDIQYEHKHIDERRVDVLTTFITDIINKDTSYDYYKFLEVKKNL